VYNEDMNRRLLRLLLSSVIFFSLMVIVLADDGPPRLENEPLGPYRLSVWTRPNPARVGELHVSATLTRSDSDAMATAPIVKVYARGVSKHDVIETTMRRDEDAVPRYHATLNVPYAGAWVIELVVMEGDWEGRASFPLEVQPAPIDKNLIRLAAFLTLVFLLTGWWFWGRKPRKKRVRKRIFMPRPDEE